MGTHPRLELVSKVVADKVMRDLKSAGISEANLTVTVLVSDTGAKGGFAYASTARREDIITLLVDFIARQDEEIVHQALDRWERMMKHGPEEEPME